MQNLIITVLILFSLANINEGDKLSNYTGWWIYGEGEHVFKDSITLEEWEMFFINDDKEAVESLYLEVAQMEYFIPWQMD